MDNNDYDNFLPYFTGDGSVGLFSDEFDDIYHSSYGALSEAFEKFASPINVNKNELKILDVCFGLGYNSKAFLTNNLNKKIIFDCLDIDKDLFLLSPFVKTNNTIFDIFLKKINVNYGRQNLPVKHRNKIIKYINRGKYKKYKINDKVNHILVKNLYEQFGDELLNNKKLNNKQIFPFFNKNILNFSRFYSNYLYNYVKNNKNNANLHNIYYWYLSKRYKYLLNNDIKFNFLVGDARCSIKALKNNYDYIFLDAFTTDKCPQLWTIDFFKELYNHTLETGVLITYSTSATVRNTMKLVGFHVGKIINNNKVIGSIASKDVNLISNPLNDYEKGLMNTKAGIPYRDLDLNSSKEIILNNRQEEIKKSNLLSSSKYIKENKGVLNEI